MYSTRKRAIELLSLKKDPNNVEYIDEILIQGFDRPENEIQLIEQMEILKEIKPENIIDYTEEFLINKIEKEPYEIQENEIIELLGIPFTWNNLEITQEDLALFPLPKAENELCQLDAFTILKQDKPENAIEERDSLLIPGLEKEEIK